MTSPAHVFFAQCGYFSAKPIHQLTTAAAMRLDPQLKKQIQGILLEDAADVVHDKLVHLLAVVTTRGLLAEQNRSRLEVLRCIDEMFVHIHPRELKLAGRRAVLPQWLLDMRARYDVEGFYEENATHRLIPRGPLVRRAQAIGAAGGDELAEHFPYISVAEKRLVLGGRTVDVAMQIVGTGLFDGMAPNSGAPSIGAEKVLFIPVAEENTDFQITQRIEGVGSFLSYQIHKDVNVAEKMMQGIIGAGQVDIAVAPEFVATELDLSNFSVALGESAAGNPRLTIAGSCNTREIEDDAIYNQATIFNSVGNILWTQRKNWPSFIDNTAAARFGAAPVDDNQHWEDNASSEELLIADVAGFGRSLVLICQDLKLNSVPELLRQYQPDWIFIPIMDSGADTGRWAHRQCFELSSRSQARFVVSCSMTMNKLKIKEAVKGMDATEAMAAAKATVIGLAVGPAAANNATGADTSDRERAVAEIAVSNYVPVDAVLQWNTGPQWMQTTVGVAPPDW